MRIPLAFNFGEGPERMDLFRRLSKDIVVGITGPDTYSSSDAVVGLGGNLANSAFLILRMARTFTNKFKIESTAVISLGTFKTILSQTGK